MAGLRDIETEQNSSWPQDLIPHPICLGGTSLAKLRQPPEELWGGSHLPCQADPPAALPVIPRLGLHLGRRCPSAEGDLPESHQADLQRSVQIRVPLPGTGRGCASGGRTGQEGACFPTGRQPRGVSALPQARGVSPCSPSQPRTTSTFRKAFFSSAFMITGGMAGAEGKEMSSQYSQPPASHGTPFHAGRDKLQPPDMGGGGETHPWPGLPCRCGTPLPGKWPSGLQPWTRPGGSRSHP